MNPSDDYKRMSFAKTLKHLIRYRGLKLTTISERTGIPVSTLSEWTAGREPKLSESLVRLAHFFDVSIEFLITGSDHGVKSLLKEETRCYLTLDGKDYCLKIESMNGSSGSNHGS